MAEQSAVVRNAADEGQVRRAGRREDRQAKRQRAVVLAQLGTPDGRAFVWEVLQLARLDASPFNTHGGIQSYNIGRQDVGRELREVLEKADVGLVLQMDAEAAARLKRDNDEIDATHTASASQSGEKR